ncbi:MAG: lipoate--protein ligase family protein [Candidatus Woesearchaeota archaeon]
MKWRIIKDGAKRAFENMSIDEAILYCSSTPTLRLYRWSPRAVSIGYFQRFSDEVDIGFCRSHGIDCVRRITGGGAVFHDKEITYSFVCGEEIVSSDILESYEKICGAVIGGLSALGVKAKFSPINDIVVSGKKISGSAQTRRNGRVLQHGTILLDLDIETMFSALKVPKEKTTDKAICDVKKRVTSIRDITANLKSTDAGIDALTKSISILNASKTDFDMLYNAIKRGFEEQFSAIFKPDGLTPKEIKTAESLAEKYLSDEWLRKR